MSSQLPVPGGNARKPRSIYPFIVMPLIAIALIVGLCTVYITNFVHAAPADQLVPLAGTVPTVVKNSKLIGATDTNQQLSLSISLQLRNAAALKGYVQDINNRQSVNYHRYLTPAQISGAFSPSVLAHTAVLNYLQESGFTITHTYKNRMLISFKGTVGQAEQVFHITINNYTSPKGETFYSNSTDPQVPSSLIASIQTISGLNNAVHFHHAPIKTNPAVENKQAIANGVACPLPSNNGRYYTPNQLATAYNLNGLYNKGYHGEGQTVALFELDTYQPGDLQAFESCYGPSHTNIVTISTSPAPTDTGVMEVELDAEVILGAAPGLGQLDIYEAANDTYANYNNEWAQIIQDNPPVVSTSWGLCDSDTGQSQAQTENNFFTIAAAQGETIVASSGDNGSSNCLPDTGSPNQNALNANDPASQPFVLGVGGTKLSAQNNGTYTSETTWNETSEAHGASGGGVSQFWPMPSWQKAPGVGTGNRETPDVSLNADPDSGYLVYCTSKAAGCTSTNGQNWYIIGGTSASAPMWAAMLALANEQSVRTGGFNLGFINPALYQIASGNNYNNDFHDITTDNNDYKNLQGGKYAATTGYDMATGLGTYNAANLANDLVSLAHNAPGGTRLSPASTTWYFAEGSVGGGFQEYLTLQNPSPNQAATVQITYLLQGHTPSTKVVTYTINPSSRFTTNVNNDLGTSPTGTHISVAAIVQVLNGGPAIVAERPMYFNFNGILSGTDVVGATNPGTTYYFAEGDSTQNSSANYATFLTMLNPSSTATAHITITYYTGSCTTNCPTQSITLGPLQRGTGSPGSINLHQRIGISVNSDQPVVVERPLYFKDNIPNAGGVTTGAASEVGATAPGTDWLFAEGFTGTGFQEYFQLANFGSTTANVTVKLEYSNGTTQNVPVTVSPYGQTRVDVNQANVGHPGDASAEITSDAPIVADRLMYFHFGSSHFSGGTDVVGIPQARNTFSFAEGFTGGQFSEFLTLQNPTANDEVVSITYFTSSTVFQQQVVVKAHSRSTISVNQAINGFAQGEVSVTIQALSGTIVAERPLYFGYGSNQGGTDVFGYTGN